MVNVDKQPELFPLELHVSRICGALPVAMGHAAIGIVGRLVLAAALNAAIRIDAGRFVLGVRHRSCAFMNPMESSTTTT